MSLKMIIRKGSNMVDPVFMRPEIALDDFLTIFVSSGLVLVFGGLYVGIYTAVKGEFLKKWTMSLAYIFWVLTAYCLYLMGSLMHVGEFTEFYYFHMQFIICKIKFINRMNIDRRVHG